MILLTNINTMKHKKIYTINKYISNYKKGNSMQKYLFVALSIGILLMAIMAFEQGKPTPKAPIYLEIKKFSPYYLEKRFGGLQIMSKKDEKFKEKPDNVELFHRLDFLEKEWGKKHLKIVDNKIIVLDDNGSETAKLPLSTEENAQFAHSFYGI